MINNALTKEDVLKITWGSELSSDDLNIYNNFVTSVAVKSVSYTHLDVYKRQVYH